MNGGERKEFLARYERDKSEPFDHRRVLESYCQDDVTVVRQAGRVLRRELLQMGNIEVFLESLTIASACDKLLRRKFMKPDTIGLIPTGGYTCNNKYSKKALMWVFHMM
jgi:rRNA maturation protein Rpf1